MTHTVHKSFLIVLGLLALPAAAEAHLTGTGLGPFYDGVTHFFLSPEQIIPVIALSLYAGLRGKQSGRIVLFLLPGAWLMGGLLGLDHPVTGQFTLLACFSFLVLGTLVASDVQLGPRFVAILALGFGFPLGFVNGSDLSTTNVGGLGVIGTATSIFVLVSGGSSGRFFARTLDPDCRPRCRKLDCGCRFALARLDFSSPYLEAAIRFARIRAERFSCTLPDHQASSVSSLKIRWLGRTGVFPGGGPSSLPYTQLAAQKVWSNSRERVGETGPSQTGRLQICPAPVCD